MSDTLDLDKLERLKRIVAAAEPFAAHWNSVTQRELVELQAALADVEEK